MSDYYDIDFDDGDYLCTDREYCDVCGGELIDGEPQEGGCPACLPCGGCYAPGSEECDFCEWDGECARAYRRLARRMSRAEVAK